jgi:hypothetical protein
MKTIIKQEGEKSMLRTVFAVLVILGLAFIIVSCGPKTAQAWEGGGYRDFNCDRNRDVCDVCNDNVSQYDPDYRFLIGPEINVLPPKYKVTLIKGKYLELDQVNVAHYYNIMDKFTEGGNHVTMLSAHLNLFKEDSSE